MNEKIEQEKHYISVLVENDLYSIIALLEESGNKDTRKQVIEEFIKKCGKINTTMTGEQLREHILLVLNRTIEKHRKLKAGQEGR